MNCLAGSFKMCLEKVSRKDAKALRNAIIGLNGLDIGTQMRLIELMNADK